MRNSTRNAVIEYAKLVCVHYLRADVLLGARVAIIAMVLTTRYRVASSSDSGHWHADSFLEGVTAKRKAEKRCGDG